MRNIPSLKSASTQITAPVPKQTLLSAKVLSDGTGGFRIIPQKPLLEIPSREVAKLLCMSLSNLSLVINSKLGRKHLRWRWLTPRQGKRIFEVASIWAFREALEDLK